MSCLWKAKLRSEASPLKHAFYIILPERPDQSVCMCMCACVCVLETHETEMMHLECKCMSITTPYHITLQNLNRNLQDSIHNDNCSSWPLTYYVKKKRERKESRLCNRVPEGVSGILPSLISLIFLLRF